MEDPVHNNNNNGGESEEERRRRIEREEAMERLLLQQEQQEQQQEGNANNDLFPVDDHNDNLGAGVGGAEGNDNAAGGAGVEGAGAGRGQEDELLIPPPPPPPPPQQQQQYSSYSSPSSFLSRLSYTQTSLFAAIALLVYALRTRKQWYLALVYIRSSKAAYIVLANALIATCVGIFRGVTKTFLGGLRLHEAEGVGDFFRWNVTETCLALTMFRSELTVSNGILFLLLVLAKCLHWVADLREGHLRVTEESIIVQEDDRSWFKGWPILQWQHAKLWIMLILLQVMDIFAVQWCGQDILAHGPSVSILFGFEAAILLVSAWNNLVLWHLHALDGWMHYLHEQTTPQQRMHRWIHPWKEHKATFTFAVEVQAQAAKFLFYVIFFAIVLTYYGMPINLFREVYVSFQALKQRLVAFAKYRRLMASMNRFQSVTEEELEEAGRDCIICRDEMSVADCKKLPGCGHIFHKSCLREWLVQQQTCPTCRGDISEMEKEAARRAAAEAAAEARANNPNATVPEGGGNTEQQQQHSPDTPAAAQQPTAGGVGAGVVPPPPPAGGPPAFISAQQPETTATTTTDNAATTKRVRMGPVVEAQAPFPALYRVVKDEGAQVCNDDGVVLRTVPFGVVVLCTTLQYKQEEGFMMRLPDGWCKEDGVVRIRTLSSLQEAARDKKQQLQ